MKNNKTSLTKKRMDILIRLLIILGITLIVFLFAIKPMLLNKDYYFEATEDYKFSKLNQVTGEDSYDVIVLGEGVDAVSAALGATKVGAKTLLVCPTEEIGENTRKTYDVNWFLDVSPVGTCVSSDIYKEIRYTAGEGSNVENYLQAFKKLISEKKLLTVLNNAKLQDVAYTNGRVDGISLTIGQEKKSVKAQRYIDATKNGELLQKCNVAYTKGYEDIGEKNLYPPVKLNFMVSGVDYAMLEQFKSKQAMVLSSIIKSYIPVHDDISIDGFNITDQGSSKVIIDVIKVKNVDLADSKQMKKAYTRAVEECNNFYNYLKLNLDLFKNAGGITIAEQFLAPSAYHFKGLYSLTLTDVLIGKRFADRVSTASGAVTMTLREGNGYILCNSRIFYMPLRSLMPEGLVNVIMTGEKVSCSSLVQTAVYSNSSNSGVGYAAGIIAAYSVSKGMELPKISEDNNLDVQLEIENILKKLGIYMSDIKEDPSEIEGNWSFPYIEKLNNLGLLSAGITNDFKLEKDAKSEDLAYILLNGVPRTSKSAYSYQFDVLVRKYVKNEPLTKELLGRILLDLDGSLKTYKSYYTEACNKGLIDQTLQDKLKDKKVLKYPELYYVSVQIIEKKTGKEMYN